MKFSVWSLYIVLLCTCSLASLAQRPPRAPIAGAGDKPFPRMLTGKILLVDRAKNEVKVSLVTIAKSPDMPGKVPTEVEQQAARLSDMADQQEAKGNKEMANNLREKAKQLRCLRVVEQTVKSTVPITGIRDASLSEAQPGILLNVTVSVTGDVAEDTTPTTASLASFAWQEMANKPQMCRHMRRFFDKNKNLFQMIGEVVSANPLVLSVNGTKVTIDNPSNHKFRKEDKLTIRDIKADQPILCPVTLDDDGGIKHIDKLIVMFTLPTRPPWDNETGGKREERKPGQ